MTGCSLNGASNPGKDTVTQELDDIGEAVGVTGDDISRFGYGVNRNLPDDRCPDVDEDDRWVADRSAIYRASSQDAALDGLIGRYRRLGADVARFKSTASETRVVIAVDSDRNIHVDAYVSAEGRTEAFVEHSPCGFDDISTPKGPYEREPL